MKPFLYDQLSAQDRQLCRDTYVRLQEGLCYYCKHPLVCPPSYEVQESRLDMSLFPSNFLQHPIHLHHSRATGLTIGAVHARCNAVLWQFHGE